MVGGGYHCTQHMVWTVILQSHLLFLWLAGPTVYISGADLIDGTPILDIKPYIGEYDKPRPGEGTIEDSAPAEEELPTEPKSDHQYADWIHHPPTDKLIVNFTPEAECQIEEFGPSHSCRQKKLTYLKSSGDLRKSIVNILEADPRSAYRRKKCADRLYYFSIDSAHVTCWFDQNVVQVLKVKHFEFPRPMT